VSSFLTAHQHIKGRGWEGSGKRGEKEDWRGIEGDGKGREKEGKGERGVEGTGS